MSFFTSRSFTQISRTPPGSFQYNFPFKMKNLDAFYLRNLALVLYIPCGACRCCNMKIMSTYNGDDRICSTICGFGCSLGFFSSVDNSTIMCRLRASKLDYAMSLASPWPLTSLVGLISKSYSSRNSIHSPLRPLGSGWVRISFTSLVGT